MNKVLYCVTNIGWYEIKIGSFKQAIFEIRILLASGKSVQQFEVYLDSPNPISFIVKGNDFVLLDR